MTANTEQWTGIHRRHYVIGILLHIQRKIQLIDNWSNKTDTLRHRIQRTAGEVLEPANNSLIIYEIRHRSDEGEELANRRNNVD